MAKQNGYAVAYGVCNNGSTPTIKDDEATPADFYIASLIQSIDMREEPSDVSEVKDCSGVIRSRLIGGKKRTITLNLVPTSGASGASQIATAEDEVKLPAIGDVLTLAGFLGESDTGGEINGDWTYQGNGRIIGNNTSEARLEVELEQVYDDNDTIVSLTPTS